MVSMKRLTFLLLVALLVVTMSTPVMAQRMNGDIRGSVKDETGAVIPGATITVTSVATGTSRTATTSEVGVYFVPSLLVGSYTVAVESSGFRRSEKTGVTVAANTTAEAHFTLEVGAVSDTVTVEAAAAHIQLTSSQLTGGSYTGETLLGATAQAGGLDGDPINLAILAPGTTTQSGGVVGVGGSVGGNRPRQNNFTVDGLDNNDPSVTGPLAPVISEAIEEFTLLTNQFDAEYGHSTAGQFITTTKSGTNSIHGKAWTYIQSQTYNSLDDLTKIAALPSPATKPRMDWKRYGAQIGGPVIKDRFFWFFSTERQRFKGSATPGSEIQVPTVAGLAALAALAGTAGSGVSPVNVGILLDHVPGAGTATKPSLFVCNEALDPGCVLGGPGAVEITIGTFKAPPNPVFFDQDLALASGDFVSDTHRISGRFHWSNFVSAGSGPLPVPEFGSSNVFDTIRVTLSDTWTHNSNMITELRVAYLRDTNGSLLPNLPPGPGNNDVFGNYTIDDLSLEIGPSGNLPQSGFDNIFQFSENFTWLTGAHTIKFGGEFRNIISSSFFLPRARGDYIWDTNLGQMSDLDSFVRDFFPAAVSIRGVGKGDFAQNRHALYWFAQDTWQVTPRLTLTLGLRYEFTDTARDADLQDVNAIANITDVQGELFTPELLAATGWTGCADVAACTLDPLNGTPIFNDLSPAHQARLLSWIGNSLIFRAPDTDNNNYGPRIGFAYDVFGDGKTSLRGGAAIGHDVFFGNLPLLQLPAQFQAEAREGNVCSIAPIVTYCSLLAPGDDPQASAVINFSGGAGTTIGFIEGGAVGSSLPTLDNTDVVGARINTGAFVFDETSPESYTWTLSIQREYWKDWTVEARYVGTRGVHLPVQTWTSPGVPNSNRLPTFGSQVEANAATFTLADPTRADLFGTGRSGGRELILFPYGFFGVATQFRPIGTSAYHGGSVSTKGNLGYGLYLDANYTWSKVTDDIENDLFTSRLNPRRPWDLTNVADQHGLSGLNHEHKFAVQWSWAVPEGFIEGKFGEGWTLSGSYIAESGQPITLLAGTDTNGNFDTAGDRAFVNTGASASDTTGTGVGTVCFDGVATSFDCGVNSQTVGYYALDPSARYVAPGSGGIPAGSLAQLGRNTWESPGINMFNISLVKKVPLRGETRALYFQVDFLNAFNHGNPVLGNGTSVFASLGNARGVPGYGTPNSSQFLQENTFSNGAGNAPFRRIIQFSLKVAF